MSSPRNYTLVRTIWTRVSSPHCQLYPFYLITKHIYSNINFVYYQVPYTRQSWINWWIYYYYEYYTYVCLKWLTVYRLNTMFNVKCCYMTRKTNSWQNRKSYQAVSSADNLKKKRNWWAQFHVTWYGVVVQIARIVRVETFCKWTAYSRERDTKHTFCN